MWILTNMDYSKKTAAFTRWTIRVCIGRPWSNLCKSVSSSIIMSRWITDQRQRILLKVILLRWLLQEGEWSLEIRSSNSYRMKCCHIGANSNFLQTTATILRWCLCHQIRQGQWLPLLSEGEASAQERIAFNKSPLLFRSLASGCWFLRFLGISAGMSCLRP